MPPAPLPQHCPSQRELDDLELLLNGALEPTTGFNEPGGAVTLALPPEVEEAAVAAGTVELVDPEGLPLARAPWPTGPLEGLARPEHGPFRRLYLPPAEARDRYAGRTVVPVWGLPSRAEIEEWPDERLLLLVLAGHGALPDTPGLLRGALAVASLLPDAAVVAVALAGGARPDVDERVLAAYGVEPGRRRSTAAPGVLAADPDAPTNTPPAVLRAAGADREQGVVLFFTGLSGSGKSTLAQALMDRVLEQTTRSITSLDGDVVRRHLSKGLTFSKEDRETNILRIGWVAAEIARHGGLAVCSPIAPFDDTRRRVREMVEEAGGRFFLVHVATPLEECERRDRKGLYAKARAGEIPEFTGISSPYEEPEDADVVVDTSGRTIEDALADVLAPLAGPVVPELADGLDTGAGAPYSTTEGPAGALYSTTEGLAGLAGRVAAEERGGVSRPPDPGTLAGRVAAEERGGVSRPPDHTGPPILRILFVCTANIARSPYMEAAARARLDPKRADVASAGVHGFDGRPADEAMRAQLDARGIDPGEFRSRAVTRDLLEQADVVLTAEAEHRAVLLEEHPESFRKIFTLGQLAAFVTDHAPATRGRALIDEASRSRGRASPAQDVADPHRRGDAAAKAAADHIDELLAVVLPALIPEKD